MKTNRLYTWIVALFVAIVFVPLTRAQNAVIGGEDTKVDYANWLLGMKTKLCVADNGWMYIMSYTVDEAGNTVVKVFRSIDDGVTFEKLKQWKAPDKWVYPQVDIMVTGKNKSDIKLWVAELANNAEENRGAMKIKTFDADLMEATEILSKEFNGRLYAVSIASDYQSPSSHSEPFGVAIALTGYDEGKNESFLHYYYSLDGGKSFADKGIYHQSEEHGLGSVNLSLGSTSEGMNHDGWSLMGVVFEMNVGEIGFLTNFINYDDAYKMTQPIKVNDEGDNTYDPKIQMMLNRESNNTVAGKACHNFIITYTDWSEEEGLNIIYLYPKESFSYKKGDTHSSMDDLNRLAFAKSVENDHAASIKYDTRNNRYRFSWVHEKVKGEEWEILYRWADYDKINDPNGWSESYICATSSHPLFCTSVEFNPVKEKACWAWVEEFTDETIVGTLWMDAEWERLTATEEIIFHKVGMELYPNPAHDYTTIRLEKEGNYQAMLYDVEGKMVRSFAFEGNEYKLEVQDLPCGNYYLRTTSGNDSYTAQLLVE
ncbi:TapA/TapC family T9SS-dependent outer membrane protein [Porphyromonas circumdentaria]|uniref:Por secretion system C-terminal sorting domain-containing protein n=1 Tax=Porphyromonas circumdentaria TaxID=29524 RepID=A0A1T4PD55_9PORP|nr:T9SS type A sorting domain-containing protein [Porphyromonas circumdentaria]MBB6276378.1 hypothetical protein [Porphyromonas circumdentaria]SJZ89136.1 Por secretion system C-terminal sorting domain-containing protein [Porphyromonas circumdentaria]